VSLPGAVRQWLGRAREPRTIGWAGVAFGALAFWIALPPWTVQSLAGPIVLGFFALACGLAVLPRGQRKLGAWALVLGLAGTLGAIWLQTKDVETLSSILTAGVLGATLRFAAPLETITPWQWDWFERDA